MVFYKSLKFAFLKNRRTSELNEKLKFIKNLTPEQIDNTHHIEHNLLPQLGLNGATNYNFEIFPKKLKPHLRSGLNIWQYPNQFAQFLVDISKLNIKNYLEIGMEYGGSFITIIEFLKIKNKNVIGLGIDYKLYDTLKVYKSIEPNVSFWAMDSHSNEVAEKLKNHTAFDLVFIDGDHTRYGVEADFNLIKDKTTHIAFHDIVDFNCNGVRDFWAELKLKFKDIYTFKEYVNQYSEIENKTQKTFLGIGLMIKK